MPATAAAASSRPCVALVTYAALPALSDDDRLLADALRARGVDVHARVWDDDTVAWDEHDAVVLRSCWDFHERPVEFLDWVDRVDALAAAPLLINGAPLVRFGVDKRYLAVLEGAGVPIVPTAWIARSAAPTDDAPDLAALLSARGWGDGAVVKPAISASAYDTWRVDAPGDGVSAQERFARAVASSAGGVMVQPFMPEVQRGGEWSLVFLGGAFSHSVVKRPAPGDFRVQQEHGGSAQRRRPTPRLVADAERALRATAIAAGVASLADVAYARVDGVERDDGLLLMELECIEPALYLGTAPGAADRLAELVVGAVSRRALPNEPAAR